MKLLNKLSNIRFNNVTKHAQNSGYHPQTSAMEVKHRPHRIMLELGNQNSQIYSARARLITWLCYRIYFTLSSLMHERFPTILICMITSHVLVKIKGLHFKSVYSCHLLPENLLLFLFFPTGKKAIALLILKNRMFPSCGMQSFPKSKPQGTKN